MTDIVKLYNPANSASLTPEELTGLQQLSSSQIRELAEAYPNSSMQRAYLLIIDSTKPPEKQLPTMSTFENLWNLREKNAQRNYVAFGYKGTYKPRTNIVKGNVSKAAKVEVLDLSETELMDLPGFKKEVKDEKPEPVKVTKIKKVKKPKSK